MSVSLFRGLSALKGVTTALTAFVLVLTVGIVARAQSPGGGLILLTDNLDAPDSGAATTSGFKKVEAGSNFEVAVDNGWVIYEGLNNAPTLNFYDAYANMLGSFKLVTPGAGFSQGVIYQAGGIVFAQCPAGQGRCSTSEGGVTGVGIGFGQANNGSSAGGWVNDDDLTEYRTNPDFAPGSIAAAAVDPTNGAFAVGWDDDATGVARATVLTLDSQGQTYAPVAQTDLGTLGGATSQAFGISKQATYIVGLATTASNKGHAVYTPTANTTSGCGPNSAGAVSTCWIDLTSAFPAGAAILKSRALVANDNGYVAGSAVVMRMVGARKTQVDIGFVYNVNTSTMTLFEAPGANVIPLQVLDDGSVVGNLNYILPKGVRGLPVYHPFVAQGATVTDFGLMTNASAGQPNYSCRVNIPNHLGELVGACIPNGTTAYGGGTAFYINAEAATPAYLDLNATLHAMNDAANPADKTYNYGTASSIDDEEEITVMGYRSATDGSITRAGFLAEQSAY